MLQEGNKIYNFKGLDQNGNAIAYKDFKGKKLVLYFYPQDLTETCTIQACNIRDNYAQLQKKGIAIVGVSPDPVSLHKKFETKLLLPFPIIADTGHSLINAFGVWGEKNYLEEHIWACYELPF